MNIRIGPMPSIADTERTQLLYDAQFQISMGEFDEGAVEVITILQRKIKDEEAWVTLGGIHVLSQQVLTTFIDK